MGRKSRYETHVLPYIDQVRDWIQLLTEDQIAKRLGVGHTSLQKYKKEHQELAQALKEGREELVENLKLTLKKKAQGFYYEESYVLPVLLSSDNDDLYIPEIFNVHSKQELGADESIIQMQIPYSATIEIKNKLTAVFSFFTVDSYSRSK